MAAKTPATVVTGFLGSGKTTLIHNLLRNGKGLKIALMINEFGDLGVDGEILKGCDPETCKDEDIVELSNGCICCTVAEDFAPALEKILSREQKPDHIVIETSGLALPQPLVRAFNWPEISTKVTVDSVVTVVDGKAVSEGQFAHDHGAVEAQRRADDSLDHETPLSELFEDQIACADMIVINKTDLIDGPEAEALAQKLKAESRNGVQVISTSMGKISPEVLLGQGVSAEHDIESRQEQHHHDDHDEGESHHDEFESFVAAIGEVRDPAAYAERIAETIRENGILRLKGFLAVAGKPMRLAVQAVGPRVDTYYDRPFNADENRESRLVVIGETGMDQDKIRSRLRES